MDRHVIILTTDKRQEKIGELLSGKKLRCSLEEYHRKALCEKIYVLPTPVSKLNNYPEMESKLKEELINCKGPVTVFGGAVSGEWKTFLERNGIIYWDFMKMQEVILGNAYITAEAALAEAISRSDFSVGKQRVLICGYGACGKEVAKIFFRMGADVIVAARRQDVRDEIETEGYGAVSFFDLADIIPKLDTVINTVPALVLDADIISRMKKSALILDIASKPGGTDFEAAKKYGIKAYHALALPGIYTTGSSAKLLADAILMYAPGESDGRMDQQWIFQIIISE